ncbi:venom protease-like [Anoplophora glabripennis]|uniref:venom protease-like n=1 Tax=Anoplophora glabripennis TaxID=217634 RepID=UPI000874109B|nr:venom protease-like [Anoplophora glabripennis]
MIGIHFFLPLFLLAKGETPENGSFRIELPEDCGTSRYSQFQSRIIQGNQARLGEFPWMARLGLVHKKLKRPMFFCGGSLISRYYVISAAHCNGIPIHVVRLGENYVEKDKDCDEKGLCAPHPQDIIVRKLMEPNYCFSDMTNDFLLIELMHPVQFNDFVKPICLPSEDLSSDEMDEEHVTISGWGLIKSYPRTEAKYLMYITAPIVAKEKCGRLFGSNLLDSQLCIGYDKGKDSCGGDSGGPVMKMIEKNGQKRAHLLGLVSYGLENCGYGPAVYTFVPSFLEWAAPNMRKG